MEWTSTRPEPTSAEETDSFVRWPIAREELMTAAANATTAAASIANVVARFIALSDHAASNENELSDRW